MQVDELIWARWIIPVDQPGRVLTDHGLAIRDGQIVATVPAAQREGWHADREISLGSHALIPGLVNTHTHAAMVLLRGVGDDLPLMRWLEEEIWPREGRIMGPEFVAAGARHAFAEMIRGGITCAKDQYFYPEAAINVAREVGFRYVAGSPLAEFATPYGSGPDEYLAKARRVMESVRGDDLVGATICPHAPYTVSDASFVAAKRLSDDFGTVLDVHVHETQGEVDHALAESGVRPLERLRKLGLLDERFLAVHMTALLEDEIQMLGGLGVQVAHCVESNLKLASGFCPVAALVDAGVNVSLGTDGAASNNDLDLMGEMRTAALVAKAISGNASAVPAARALEMATLGGARALHLDHRIGSLEPGKAADITAVDLGELETQPVEDVISHVVYAASRWQVSDVWIAGRRVLEQRELKTMDATEVVRDSQHWRRRMAAAT